MDTSPTNDDSYIFDIRTIEEFSWFVEEQRLYIPLSYYLRTTTIK